MGKKVNPKVIRLKINKNWDSRWYADKAYASLLQADIKIKEYLKKKLRNAFIASVEIERTAKAVNVLIFSGRPGIIIGRGGTAVEELKKEISRKFIKNNKVNVNLNIKEVSDPNGSAALVAQSIVFDLEKRIPYRRAMKQAISKVEKTKALGVKVQIGGRLNGAEIARKEKLISGKIPLHTLRADIDYAYEIAHTIYGTIGVKVWIYKGDVFNKKEKNNKKIKK